VARVASEEHFVAALDIAHGPAERRDMTAFILGVMPLVVATGAGQEGRHSVGTAVAGGMLFATFPQHPGDSRSLRAGQDGDSRTSRAINSLSAESQTR
jgi:hypothetical protein